MTKMTAGAVAEARWLAERLFGALDARDLDALAGLLSDDASFRFGNGPELHGRDAVVEATGGFLGAVAGTAHEVTGCVGGPEAFVAETRVRYVRHDGGEVVLPAATSVRVRDGLMSRVQVFMDAAPVFAPPHEVA